jgi:hypothetical protein
MLALKGQYPADELKDVPEAWEYEVCKLEVPGRNARHVVSLRHGNV